MFGNYEYYNQSFNIQPFLIKLKNNELTLENILDEDEIIDDIKFNTDSEFIDFLTKEKIKKLIDYSTKMPESDSHNIGFKYPFNATEILCSENVKFQNKFLEEKPYISKEVQMKKIKEKLDKRNKITKGGFISECFRTSALNGYNIENAINFLVDEIINKIKKEENNKPKNNKTEDIKKSLKLNEEKTHLSMDDLNGIILKNPKNTNLKSSYVNPHLIYKALEEKEKNAFSEEENGNKKIAVKKNIGLNKRNHKNSIGRSLSQILNFKHKNTKENCKSEVNPPKI